VEQLLSVLVSIAPQKRALLKYLGYDTNDFPRAPRDAWAHNPQWS